MWLDDLYIRKKRIVQNLGGMTQKRFTLGVSLEMLLIQDLPCKNITHHERSNT